MLRYAKYFECARQVGVARATKSQRVVYFLITDSNHLRSEALLQLPGQVIVAGLGIQHLEYSPGSPQDHYFGLMNMIAEQYAMAETDFQVRLLSVAL